MKEGVEIPDIPSVDAHSLLSFEVPSIKDGTESKEEEDKDESHDVPQWTSSSGDDDDDGNGNLREKGKTGEGHDNENVSNDDGAAGNSREVDKEKDSTSHKETWEEAGEETHEMDFATGMDNEVATREVLSIDENSPFDLPVTQTPSVA